MLAVFGLALILAVAFAACWPLLARVDNELGADMTLQDRIRRYLGTDPTRMEQNMATWTAVLNGLVEQTTAASAAQATSFSNLQSAITRQTAAISDLQRQLEVAVANGDAVPEGMQAKVAEISAALDDMKKAADTADNGFEPVEEEPTDEVPPVENPDVPVEPPVEGEPTDGSTLRRR